MSSTIKVYVKWSSKFTEDLVVKALGSLSNYSVTIEKAALADDQAVGDLEDVHIVQWSEYDSLSHTLTQNHPKHVTSSSYTIRKALIRKHFLHRNFINHFAKHPDSSLKRAVPQTWDIDLAFADELDDMWGDDLWELGQILDGEAPDDVGVKGEGGWFILKPGMADRGMGLRMFNSKEGLQRILDQFEAEAEEEEDDDDVHSQGGGKIEKENGTGVAVSQLRHFVIQEYLPSPLLINPLEAQVDGALAVPGDSPGGLGRKFHLRAYCVASGALTLYLCPNILALFAAVPYTEPNISAAESGDEGAHNINLAPHLTNSSLQKGNDSLDDSVRLLSELVGCPVYSASSKGTDISYRRLSQDDINDIVNQVATVLAQTFQVATENPVHFQPLPNAFELFGADLLVSDYGSGKFQVHILELNAEPAIELTGPRLSWILEELFVGISQACVGDVLGQRVETQSDTSWKVGERRHGLQKCLEMKIRGSGGW